MGRANILIVDDSIVMRRLLREVISADPTLAVQGLAPHGKIALSMIKSSPPHLVVLDIEMPEMDGLETLVEIRKFNQHLPVIMFSTFTEKGADATIESLMKGASDYVTKPAGAKGLEDAAASIRKQLLPKIKALCSSVLENNSSTLDTAPASFLKSRSGGQKSAVEILAIGSSTGGPNALVEVISKLPEDFPVPVVITQHMPPMFTKHLADRMNACSSLHVREAQGGEILQAGDVWVAPGDYHMVVKRQKANIGLELNQEPAENSCRPSVDVMFRSIAEIYGGSCLGVILTGMGQDGLIGCRNLVQRGSRVLAQDKATSVVWGMPGFVAEAGLAEQILPLDQIADEIASIVYDSRVLFLRK